MSVNKLRKFARYYPKGHLQEGKKTLFVEKILNSLGVNIHHESYLNNLFVLNHKAIAEKRLSDKDIYDFYSSLGKTDLDKHHTIRSGNHFKSGDYLTPSVWSGLPYKSPQIIFYNSIEVVKTFDFSIDEFKVAQSKEISNIKLKDIAVNDGLTFEDFCNWFNLDNPKLRIQPFSGQIICWSKKINYI